MNYMAMSGKQIWKQLWWFVQLVFRPPPFSCHSSSVQHRSDENLHKVSSSEGSQMFEDGRPISERHVIDFEVATQEAKNSC